MATKTGDVEDPLALRGLVDAYATAVDARDADAFASLFLADGCLAVYEADAAAPAVEYRGTEELKSVMSAPERVHQHIPSHGEPRLPDRWRQGRRRDVLPRPSPDRRRARTRGRGHGHPLPGRVRAHRRRLAGRTARRAQEWTEVRPAEVVPLLT